MVNLLNAHLTLIILSVFKKTQPQTGLLNYRQILDGNDQGVIGVMNGPLKFLTARKIYLCSICSQNLSECSLARVPQIFALLAKTIRHP